MAYIQSTVSFLYTVSLFLLPSFLKSFLPRKISPKFSPKLPPPRRLPHSIGVSDIESWLKQQGPKIVLWVSALHPYNSCSLYDKAWLAYLMQSLDCCSKWLTGPFYSNSIAGIFLATISSLYLNLQFFAERPNYRSRFPLSFTVLLRGCLVQSRNH